MRIVLVLEYELEYLGLLSTTNTTPSINEAHNSGCENILAVDSADLMLLRECMQLLVRFVQELSYEILVNVEKHTFLNVVSKLCKLEDSCTNNNNPHLKEIVEHARSLKELHSDYSRMEIDEYYTQHTQHTQLPPPASQHHRALS